MRLVRVGRRSEERGRDACVMGRMCHQRRVSRLCGVACSGKAAYDGSSASYVRFICCVVDAVQKTVYAEPMAAAISTTTQCCVPVNRRRFDFVICVPYAFLLSEAEPSKKT